MKDQLLIIFLFAVILANSCGSAKQTDTEKAFVVLYEKGGHDWSVVGEAEWTHSDGILTGTGGRGYAVTNEKFEDFILEAEFFPDRIINSGIFIRCPEKEGSAVDCYEINIFDDHTNQAFRTGAIVTHGKPLVHENSVGKWNQYRIKAEKDRIEVWLNGKKTADLKDSKTEKGHIAIQVFDQGVIQFKNIRIRKL